VSLLIGEECGVENLSNCALAFTQVTFWEEDRAFVGVISSKRMEYSKVLAALSEVKSALTNSISGWR
jgi:transcriptional regulator of heat shock response